MAARRLLIVAVLLAIRGLLLAHGQALGGGEASEAVPGPEPLPLDASHLPVVPTKWTPPPRGAQEETDGR